MICDVLLEKVCIAEIADSAECRHDEVIYVA